MARRRCAAAAGRRRRATVASRRSRARRSSASATTWWCACAPTPDGARIDVRSASRYGRHDLGGNAARVRALIDDVDDVLATPTPEKKQPVRPKPLRPAGKGQFGQAVGAADRRRAFGRDDAARDQILEMRQHGKRGGAGQPRIEPDIDRPHQRRDVGGAFAEPPQDRCLAALPVADVAAARSAARRARGRRGRAGRSARVRRASFSSEAM